MPLDSAVMSSPSEDVHRARPAARFFANDAVACARPLAECVSMRGALSKRDTYHLIVSLPGDADESAVAAATDALEAFKSEATSSHACVADLPEVRLRN